MTGQTGDKIVLMGKSKKARAPERSGVIEDVLDAGQPRYLVRWDDGRSAVIAPAPGSVRIEPAPKKRRAPAKAAAPAAKKPATRRKSAS
jgi:hypothetical protein